MIALKGFFLLSLLAVGISSKTTKGFTQQHSATSRTVTVGTTHHFGYLDSLNFPSAPSSSSSNDSMSSAPAPSNGNTFQQVPILSLQQADDIVNSAIGVCQRNRFNPVTVLVLDASGSMLVCKRMDGCSPVGVQQFAFSKAYSCLVNKYPSRAFRDRYTAEPNQAAKFCQMTSMVAISGNQMAPFPGGILLTVGDHIIGAVGVSGAAGDEDEYCAIQGVVEAGIGGGLTTIPDQHSCSTVKD